MLPTCRDYHSYAFISITLLHTLVACRLHLQSKVHVQDRLSVKLLDYDQGVTSIWCNYWLQLWLKLMA